VRICLLINTLRPYGAERVAMTLANAWAASEHEMTICTFDDDRRDVSLLPIVKHRFLDPGNPGIGSLFKLALRYRTFAREFGLS
jgi:hypothetical protein